MVLVVVGGGKVLVEGEERERMTGGEDISDINFVASAGSPKLLTGSKKDPRSSGGGFE